MLKMLVLRKCPGPLTKGDITGTNVRCNKKQIFNPFRIRPCSQSLRQRHDQMDASNQESLLQFCYHIMKINDLLNIRGTPKKKAERPSLYVVNISPKTQQSDGCQQLANSATHNLERFL